MVTGASCLVSKYQQPTGAAGPVSSNISKTGAADGGHGSQALATLPGRWLSAPLDHSPHHFSEHGLNSDNAPPPTTPLSAELMFPKSVLGPQADPDPAILKMLKACGGWGGSERVPRVRPGLRCIGTDPEATRNNQPPREKGLCPAKHTDPNHTASPQLPRPPNGDHVTVRRTGGRGLVVPGPHPPPRPHSANSSK